MENGLQKKSLCGDQKGPYDGGEERVALAGPEDVSGEGPRDASGRPGGGQKGPRIKESNP